MPRSSVPSDKYWINDLEFDPAEARASFDDAARETWVQKRTGRQAQVLCEALGLNANSTYGRKQALRDAGADLDPYMLVSAFGSGRAEVTVRDHAERALTPDVLASCTIASDRIDKLAVLFELFRSRPASLRTVRLLDKIHKSGFAPMKLVTATRAPARSLHEFLSPTAIKPMLAAVDRAVADRRTSLLREVVLRNGRCLVFIRRADRPRFGLRVQGQPAPCYDSDTIVLDMGSDAKRIGVAARSGSVAAKIANAIATGYFGKACEYRNETNAIPRDVVHALLTHLRSDPDGPLVLVEVTGTSAHLPGSPLVTIEQPAGESIGEALRRFEEQVGPIDIEDIECIHVRFRKKRVKLDIAPADGSPGCFSLRYSDFRLNALERVDFENHLRDVHNVAILSREMQRV